MGSANVDADEIIKAKGDCLIKVDIRVTSPPKIVVALSGDQAYFSFLSGS